MNVKQRKPRALAVLLLAPLALAAAFTAHSAMAPGDPDSGKWVASPIDDCAGNLICVEWQYTVLGQPTSDEACCIDPVMVGSTQYLACDSYFRHEPH